MRRTGGGGSVVRRRTVFIGTAFAVVCAVLAAAAVYATSRYEFVGLRPHRCGFVSGSVPTETMVEVGLDRRVQFEGVDAPAGALAQVTVGDERLVAARLVDEGGQELGVAVWQQDSNNTHTRAVNALARRWSHVDAPAGETGGIAASVVARCLSHDRYP